jgi:hypothetical protein
MPYIPYSTIRQASDPKSRAISNIRRHPIIQTSRREETSTAPGKTEPTITNFSRTVTTNGYKIFYFDGNSGPNMYEDAVYVSDVTNPDNIEIFVTLIGGGGGGGDGTGIESASGGGAGGLEGFNALPTGSYEITVGGGGLVMSDGKNTSINDGGSYFYEAYGGGYGGNDVNQGNNGGCGGGSQGGFFTGGLGSQGGDGGMAPGGIPQISSGGGGLNEDAGNGGNGSQLPPATSGSGGAGTQFVDGLYYGGGGGGGQRAGTIRGQGGIGGGG